MTRESQAHGETGSVEFVLDMESNPHPEMRERALHLRRTARSNPDSIMGAFWLGYRECMVDATGLPVDEIEAWLDRQDHVDVEGHVELRGGGYRVTQTHAWRLSLWDQEDTA